jgi:CRISPR-associated protein Cas1
MVALPTVQQPSTFRKSSISKSGVLTIHGFGIRVRMQSGHLEIEDGIGPDRRKIRLARVGHGLKRLVLIGSDGFITLEALHWFSAQDVAFVMLERNGKVVCVTGPVRPSDARLRRAQALAGQSEVGIQIVRELINKKLRGQEHVLRHKLLANDSADVISRYLPELSSAYTLERIRSVEAKAAAAYWSVWRNLPIRFPKRDEPRIPDHWRVFGARVSPLTGSPRIAVNPSNAILNYLYGLLYAEARLAAAALGLDPGLGMLHVDIAARDSLACDLMEVVRPRVDAYLLDWITRDPLKREWFSERPDGNCRLTASLAVRLSETASMWGRAVAPVAEWLAQELWSSPRRNSVRNQSFPTRLTQNRKRNSQGGPLQSTAIRPPRRAGVCRECGATIEGEYARCGKCRIQDATNRMVDVARVGRLTAHGIQAQARRSNTQHCNALLQHSWQASSQPAWLTEEFYSEKIQPLLSQLSGTAIARALGVTCAYGRRICQGSRPHPRHWQALARLVGVSESTMAQTLSLEGVVLSTSERPRLPG